jgi:hypothetical protein
VRAAVGDRRCARWSAAVGACRRLTDGGGGGRRGLDASEAEAAGMASEEASAWKEAVGMASEVEAASAWEEVVGGGSMGGGGMGGGTGGSQTGRPNMD